jgi:hypothetical protein
MNVYICLPNDEEFEFEADISYRAGTPGKFDGPPENCYPDEPAECEFNNYGPFNSMFDAVYTACWMHECPMSEADMAILASRVEEESIQKVLDSPPEYEPEVDECEWE